MRHRLSTTSGMLLLLLLAIGASVLFGLARQHLPPATHRAAPQAAIAQLATPLPDDGWPTPLPPGVTNTPPTPTPGIFYLLDEVPPGVEIAPAIPDEPEMPEPAIPAMGESPTPIPLPPTVTPLPTVSLDNRSPYAAHNLVLVPGPTPVSEKLQSPSSGVDPQGFSSWSPDGSLFAHTEGVGEYKFYLDKDGIGTGWRPQVIVLFDVAGREIEVLTEGDEPLWSPDGDYIAVLEWDMEQRMGAIKIVDVATRGVTRVTALAEQHVRPSMTWISASQLLFYLGTHEQGELLVFDIETGEQRPLLTGAVAEEIARDAPGSILYRLSALPSQGLIAINTNARLFILRRDEQGLAIVQKLAPVVSGHAVFAPDGSAVAYVTGLGPRIVSRTEPDRQPVELVFGEMAWPLIWSPDGSSILFRTRMGWYIVNRDGSGLRLLDELPSPTYSIWWTARGMWVSHGEDGRFSIFSVGLK